MDPSSIWSIILRVILVGHIRVLKWMMSTHKQRLRTRRVAPKKFFMDFKDSLSQVNSWLLWGQVVVVRHRS